MNPRFPICCLLSAVLLVGCGKPPEPDPAKPGATPSPTPKEEEQNPVKIGFFAPLTGSQASFGKDAIQGAQLAVEVLNAAGGVLDRPIKLILKDTQSNEEETTKVVQEMAEEKLPVIIGEITSDRTILAAKTAQELGVPMISPGATHGSVTATGNFIFRVCYADPFQGIVMSKFARSIDVKQAAILFDPENPYSAGLAEAFRQDFTAGGGTITKEETYKTGERDFSRQLNAIKATQPEIIFLPSYYTESAAIITQARQVGIEVPFLGTDGWDSPEFLKIGGKAVDNTYFANHFSHEEGSERVSEFSLKFTEKYGSEPPPLAALSYDAVMLAASAIGKAASEDREAIRQALSETKDFPAVTGNVTFDENRNPRKPAIVIRVEDGRFSYLETVQP